MSCIRHLENQIVKLKSELDDLVRERENERLTIREDVEGSDDLFLALEQAVNEKYRELMDARYELRYARGQYD